MEYIATMNPCVRPILHPVPATPASLPAAVVGLIDGNSRLVQSLFVVGHGRTTFPWGMFAGFGCLLRRCRARGTAEAGVGRGRGAWRERGHRRHVGCQRGRRAIGREVLFLDRFEALCAEKSSEA